MNHLKIESTSFATLLVLKRPAPTLFRLCGSASGVDEKQKEVMDSIRYAQRIQRAHLPNEKHLAKTTSRLQKK